MHYYKSVFKFILWNVGIEVIGDLKLRLALGARSVAKDAVPYQGAQSGRVKNKSTNKKPTDKEIVDVTGSSARQVSNRAMPWRRRSALERTRYRAARDH